MAEFSLFHTTSTSGDGASAYTQAQLLAWLRRTFTATPATEGVLKNYANGLAVSGSATPLTVATGAAVVDGFPYENDTAVSLAVPTPTVGTTGKRVVLRADYVAHTVRIALISSADGVSAFPALTQNAGVTWEISLATLSVTTTGVITVTDARSFAHFSTQVNLAMIDDGVIDATKINASAAGNGLSHSGTNLAVNVDGVTLELAADALQIKNDAIDDLKVGNRVPALTRRRGGDPLEWAVDGATDYTPGAVRMAVGYQVASVAAAASGAIIITLPAGVFSQKPLLFVTGVNNGFVHIEGAADTTTQGTVQWKTLDSSTRTAIGFQWLAIGPE